MKTLFVRDLTSGMIINKETFVVAEVKSANDKNGKPYYDVILVDKTGTIKAKIWSDAIINVERAALVPNKIVAVEAKIEDFRGIPQLNITKLMGVDGVELDDYMESAMFPAEDMFNELVAEVNSFKNPHLKQLCLNFLNHPEWGAKFRTWPAARDVHHDFHSGLLQHVLEMISISKGLQRFYPQANFEVLTTGIIFHDAGKIMELDGAGIKAIYTSLGSLMGHIVLGVEMVQQILPEGFPEDLLWCVKHMILSHHGTKEYGSPVIPSTIEAIMLCHLDNLSAKSRTAERALQAVDKTEMWSAYNTWLGTKMFGGLMLGVPASSDVSDFVDDGLPTESMPGGIIPLPLD